jgi:radical S-adenosyl methionine domain-containing protein 2
MAKSYLILDEYMRFLDRDGRLPSKPILEIGVREALKSVFWDEQAFKDRGGVYDWSREDSCGREREEIAW